MNYEVLLIMGKTVVVSWRFKTITQVVKFLENTDTNLLVPKIYRMKDYFEFDYKQLMVVWHA